MPVKGCSPCHFDTIGIKAGVYWTNMPYNTYCMWIYNEFIRLFCLLFWIIVTKTMQLLSERCVGIVYLMNQLSFIIYGISKYGSNEKWIKNLVTQKKSTQYMYFLAKILVTISTSFDIKLPFIHKKNNTTNTS